MYEGFIFAQKVDDGFPGGRSQGAKATVAFYSVVFVQADSLNEALRYLMDNTSKLECMEGAYIGLRELAEDAESVEQLKKKIDKSWVNGDSEAKVIYANISVPELPLEDSNCFLRFMCNTDNLFFVGVCDLRSDTATYKCSFESYFGQNEPNILYQADIQLSKELFLNVNFE